MNQKSSSVLFKSYDPINGVIDLIHNINDCCFIKLLQFDDDLDNDLSDKYVTDELEHGFQFDSRSEYLWTNIVDVLKNVSCWQVRVQYSHVHDVKYFLFFKTVDEALLAKLSFD